MEVKTFENGYSDVNGLRMYYEIHGRGFPLVLIHGGGSTIQSTFGNIIPYLSGKHKVIAMELQAHGRTNDRNEPLSFSHDADDVATVLKNINVERADFLGFSNGGQTLIELALRHSSMINKLIISSAFYKRGAVPPEFWKIFEHPSFGQMPEKLKQAFLKVNNDEKALLNMFNKDSNRMKNFKGWTDEQMKSISSPALILNGDHDIGSVEHSVEMFRIMPNARLAILPGTHGSYLGTIETIEDEWTGTYVVDLVEEFLQC